MMPYSFRQYRKASLLLFSSLLFIIASLTTQSAPAQENWVLQSPATKPPGRFYDAMAYDATNQEIVLFGGEASSGTDDPNTWLWDGANWTSYLPSPSPGTRNGHAMAFDSTHNQVVLFGGYSGTTFAYVNDTWVWDGGAKTWTLLSPANSPPPLFGAAMAYDPIHGQVVLFGGDDGINGSVGDTWVWDGTTWTKLSLTTSPSPRELHKMVYDAALQKIVLFGGAKFGGGFEDYGDTWTWDGTQWTQAVTTTSPPTRYNHAMAYDASQSQVVVFGGVVNHNAGCGSDTWTWKGGNWAQLMPANSPVCLEATNMEYDAAEAQVVLFGLIGGNDTWTFGVPQPMVKITVPAGVQFTFNGQTYTGSQTITIGAGSYDLSTTSPQATGTGTQAVFQSWSDAGAQEHMVTVGTTSVNITGTFTTQYLLTTAVNPPGAGSITPSGYYNAGSQVTVIALTNPGFAFSSWSGGACSSASGFCIFTINGPASATANFVQQKFLVSVNVPAGVQYTLSGFPFTGSTSLSLPAGSYGLTLVSPQSSGVGSQLVFTSWSDSGAQSHNIVVSTSNVTVTGFFKMQYLLTVSATPSNEGSVSPGTAYYDAGSTAIPIAFATAGYNFEFWSGACTGSSALCVVIMNSPQSVTANFSIPLAWVQLFPANSPSARQLFAMAYDAAHQQTVLFGGFEQTTTGTVTFGDTWTYDGVNWTQVFPATSPSARGAHVMAYDAARQRVVLFGGDGLSDTWVWDGSNWTLEHPATSPPGISFVHQSMAYDPVLQETVLYGGVDNSQNLYHNTWVWDGTNWTQRGNATPQIPEGSLAYDAARQRIVLAAPGIAGGTWVWDGTNWTEASAFAPGTTIADPTAYDTLHQQTVLYNFDASNLQTWLWDGTNWTQHSPAVQPNADYPSMVYDGARQDVLLFGGGNPQTWVWIAPSVNLVPQAPTVVNDGVGDYLVTVTLKNQGNVPISIAFVTSATLGGNATTGFTTPQVIGPINPGATGSFTAKFPVSKFNSLTKPAIVFQGTYNAGTVVGAQWSASTRGITLP